MGESSIAFEVMRAVMPSRDGDRTSVRPGARLRIAADDASFSDTQLQTATRAGKLRPIEGLLALAVRLAD